MADKITQISQGKLRGKEHTSPSGKVYYGFHGIPYAEPPTGSNRFKDPIPAHDWPDIKGVTEEKTSCFAQIDMFTNEFAGIETLTLNVYTPQIKNRDKSPLAVMVYFHGGGFLLGSTDLFGPDYLLEKNVVVVSVQYRLGVFGFLCLDLPDAPGNVGLKDQVLALQWVQKNICVFDGDSSNVTIFGTSAGGASVEYHIISAMSKNLFHKAIANSGGCLNPWAYNPNPKASAIALAKKLGKNTNDEKELLDFFISLPVHELCHATHEIHKVNDSLWGGLDFIFVPTVEKRYDNVLCFLHENPLEILKSGRQNNVPLITGFAEKEGLMFEKFLPTKFDKLSKDQSVTSLLPFHIEDKSLVSKINEFYGKYESNEDMAIDFFGDMDFIAGVILSAILQSENNAKIYLYNFKYDGGLNGFKKFMKINKPGATHADQENYISSKTMTNLEEASETDVLVRERLVQMMSNFAKTGNPTPKITAAVPVKWLPMEKGKLNCLNIEEELKMEELSQDEWIAIWKGVYENPRI